MRLFVFEKHGKPALGLRNGNDVIDVEASGVDAPADIAAPSGVGNAREPRQFMKPGDTCEVEIEKIGLLRNPIVQET
jgi:hypothetical protein